MSTTKELKSLKISVDELIIAANYSDPVNDVKEMLSANEHEDEESWETWAFPLTLQNKSEARMNQKGT